jgi:hypothetical protein
MSTVYTRQQRVHVFHVVSCVMRCRVRFVVHGHKHVEPIVMPCVHNQVSDSHTSLKDRSSGETNS